MKLASSSRQRRSSNNAPSLIRPITGTGSARNEAASSSAAAPLNLAGGLSAIPALGNASSGSEPLPIWLVQAMILASTCAPSADCTAGRTQRLRLDIGKRAREPVQCRQLLLEAIGIGVEPEYRFERSQRHLVDA